MHELELTPVCAASSPVEHTWSPHHQASLHWGRTRLVVVVVAVVEGAEVVSTVQTGLALIVYMWVLTAEFTTFPAPE